MSLAAMGFILLSAIISAQSDISPQEIDDECHACVCNSQDKNEDLWSESGAPERRTGGDGPWWKNRYEKEYMDAMTITVLLAITMVFEFFHHYTKHLASEYGNLGLLAHIRNEHHDHVKDIHARNLWEALHVRCSSELSVLGFLALSVWISNKAGLFEHLAEAEFDAYLPKTDSAWLHHIEAVHMHLFITMCLYFVSIGINVFVVEILIEKAVDANYAITTAYQEGRLEVGDEEKYFENEGIIFKSVMTLRQYYFVSLQQLRGQWSFLDEHIAYLHADLVKDASMFNPIVDIDQGDLDALNIPDMLRKWFPFDLYIVVNYRHTLDELISVKWTTWLAIVLLLLVQAVIQRLAETDLYMGIGYACLCQIMLIIMAGMNHVMYEHACRTVRDHWNREAPRTQWVHRVQPVTYMARILQVCIFFSVYELASTIATKSEWEQYPRWCLMHVLILVIGGIPESLLIGLYLPRWAMLISSGRYMQTKHVLYMQCIVKAFAAAKNKKEAAEAIRELAMNLERFDSRVFKLEKSFVCEKKGEKPTMERFSTVSSGLVEAARLREPSEEREGEQSQAATERECEEIQIFDCETYSI
mmetsp:Transcript_134382/g.245239  ORF Transcript_134382/g.245239 Transcript_134382/m.245239 type:complete len:587 (+) Transcript_134382:203-1963(+)